MQKSLFESYDLLDSTSFLKSHDFLCGGDIYFKPHGDLTCRNGHLLAVDIPPHQTHFFSKEDLFLEYDWNSVKESDVTCYNYKQMYVTTFISPVTKLPRLLISDISLGLSRYEMYIPLPEGKRYTVYFLPGRKIWYNKETANTECYKEYYSMDICIGITPQYKLPIIHTKTYCHNKK